ncbi:hypothetical protein DYB32_009688, partial [Aphanomyces invadans]
MHHVARVIQTRYRGWSSRKFKLNFATRKLYLKELEAKGQALRETLRQRLDAQRKPTAFGVPVETHIRTNTLNYLATVPKKLVPKAQLKPKPPTVRTSLQATSVYQADKLHNDREKRYQKASQITENNFVTVVNPASSYTYDKSVNNGIEYLDPRKHPFCQRSANKSPVKSRESIVLPPATRPSAQGHPHVKKKTSHNKRTVKPHGMEDEADDLSDSEESPFNAMTFHEGESDSDYTLSDASDADNSDDDDVDAEEDASLVPDEEIDLRLWSNAKEKQQWTLQYERTNAEWQRKYGCRIDSEARPEVSAKLHRERRWRRVQQIFVVLAVVAYIGQWWAIWNNYDVGRMTAPFRVEWWRDKSAIPVVPNHATDHEHPNAGKSQLADNDTAYEEDSADASTIPRAPQERSDDGHEGAEKATEPPEANLAEVDSATVLQPEHMHKSDDNVAGLYPTIVHPGSEPKNDAVLAALSNEGDETVAAERKSSSDVEGELAVPEQEDEGDRSGRLEVIATTDDSATDGHYGQHGRMEGVVAARDMYGNEAVEGATSTEMESTAIVDTSDHPAVVAENNLPNSMDEEVEHDQEPIEWQTDISGAEMDEGLATLASGNTTARELEPPAFTGPIEVSIETSGVYSEQFGELDSFAMTDRGGGERSANEDATTVGEVYAGESIELLSVEDEGHGTSLASDANSEFDAAMAEEALAECASQTKALVRDKFPTGHTASAKIACDHAVDVTIAGSSWHVVALVARGDLKSFMRDFGGAIDDYNAAMVSEHYGRKDVIQLKWQSVQWMQWYFKGAVDELTADCERVMAREESLSTLQHVARQWLDVVQLQT